VCVPVLDRYFKLPYSSPCDLLSPSPAAKARRRCLLLILISNLDGGAIDLMDQAVEKKENNHLDLSINTGEFLLLFYFDFFLA
jgi:hypothetical protein